VIALMQEGQLVSELINQSVNWL